MDKIFKQLFRVEEEEKLLNVSQLSLSSIASLIAGLLFISTYEVAFCCERPIKFSSTNILNTWPYASIPFTKVRRVRRVRKSESMKNTSQKYMEIVTVDEFDFWFMSFLNYKKTFKYLESGLPKH
ncbi:hypothetical protein MANES_12G083216v8 [Manihot esculenta]|uniref:Uncharacterized protein n=1 Tax=Manihot esculenta TaxID=3983 RepID=A0ACB7GPS7_MANES|nr:hypothetical protein MANES_12G083216v8 [Manihot esculenta]